MHKFNPLISLVALIGALLFSPTLQARTLLSDAPFPWGTEVPLHWPALNGTWVAETGSSSPLVFRFKVAERGGGVFLVTSQVLQQYHSGTMVAQGYAFVVEGQKYINIPYFGDGVVPLAILRKYPSNYLGPMDTRESLILTWVWDANNPSFIHQHFILEKISNESDL